MNPDRWQRVKAVLQAALERPRESRTAFLAEACDGDLELRGEVEALLDSYDRAGSFIDQPVFGDSSVRVSAGTRLGPYEVIAPLGSGGMGEVYRARDTKLHRDVALKVLPGLFALDTDRLARFNREAQLLASLNHPNIAAIYGFEESAGVRALVLELVDGPTLAHRISQGPISLDDALRIARQIAEALEAAHERGIIHRDLKPSNIKLRPDGTVKVLDFGLAKVQTAEGSRPDWSQSPTVTAVGTREGIFLGTPAYMSPEQARGQAVDKRTDIWAFGCVLYEMLSGRPAFGGETVTDTLAAIIEREPDWPALPDATPPNIRRLVQRCLTKDPKHRLHDIADARIEIDEARSEQLAGIPRRTVAEKPIEKAPTVDALPVTQARAGRRWKRAAALVVPGLALVVGGALFLTRGPQPTEPPRIEYTQLTNFADSVVAPSLSPDGRMLAFIRGENTFLGPGEVYVKLLPDGEPVQLTRDGRAKMGPTVFSPDGSRIAYTVGTRETWIVPVLGGESSRMLANAGGLTWISDGTRRVLFSKSMGVGIHMGLFTSTESRSDERKVYLPVDVNGMAHRSFLSPDQKSVLAAEMDLGGWLPCRLIPFDGSSPGTPVGPSPAQCTDAAWSPDGQWMYFSANTGNGFHIWRQRFSGGQPEQVTSGATEEQGIAFAPDGRSFVTSVGESQSTLWVQDSRGEKQITSQGFAFLPSFSADGRNLYYLQRSRADRRFVSGELWVTNIDTGRRERLLPDFLMEHYSVSSDATRVVFVSIDEAGRSDVWLATLNGSAPPRRLVSLDLVVRALFHPDGSVLFVGGERGAPYLYRVGEDGAGPEKVLPKPITFIYGVSPDGKALAVWEGSSVLVYPSDGGTPALICSRCATAGEENRGITPPLVSWSPDGRFVYMHSAATRETYVIPLREGQRLPPLPASGLASMEAAAHLPGARAIPQQRAFGGVNPSIYAFPRVTTHRNIYRIRVP